MIRIGTQDKILNDMAQAMNNESYEFPSYLAVATTEVTIIPVTDGELSGEVGTRTALTGSRTTNSVTYSAIRSGTDVIDTANGDEINQSGLHASLSATDDLQFATMHNGVTQTTNFDLDFQYTVKWVRR